MKLKRSFDDFYPVLPWIFLLAAGLVATNVDQKKDEPKRVHFLGPSSRYDSGTESSVFEDRLPDDAEPHEESPKKSCEKECKKT